VTKVLLDLNVLLDVILDRKPGVRAAARLWAGLEQGGGQGFIPGHGVTTVFYILEKARGAAFARRAVEQLLHVFAVAPITDVVLRRALVFAWPDFEDAVCAASAEAAGCDLIVSRDPAGFPDAPIPVIDAAAAMGLLTQR
jgi:predicted nucleic acid-binding protein